MALQRLEKEGIFLNVSDFSMFFPLFLQLENVEIASPSSFSLEIEKVKISPSILLIFSDQLALSSLKAKNLSYKSLSTETKPLKAPLSFPWDLSIFFYELDDVFVENSKVGSFSGSLFIEKDLKAINAFSNVFLLKEKAASFRLKTKKHGTGFLRGSFFLKPLSYPAIPFQSKGDFRFSFQDQALKRLLLYPELDPLMIKGSLSCPINWEKDSFYKDFLGKSRLSSEIFLSSDRSLVTKGLKLSTDVGSIQGSIQLKKDFQIEKIHLSTQNFSLDSPLISEEIAIKKIQGFFSLIEDQEGFKTAFGVFGEKLFLRDLNLEKIAVESKGVYADKEYIGELDIEGIAAKAPIEGKSPVSINFSEGIFLQDLFLSSSYGTIQGALEIDWKGLIEGSLSTRSDELSLSFDEKILQGSWQSSIDFTREEKQNIHLHLFGSNVLYDQVFVEEIHVDLNALESSFWEWNLAASFANLRYQSAWIEKGNFSTSNEQENYPYALSIQGDWRGAFSLTSNGFWRQKSNQILLSMQSFEGSYANEPFLLEEPFQYEKEGEKIRLSPFFIRVQEGFFQGNMLLEKEEKKAFFELNDFPLIFFSLNPYDIPFEGRSSTTLSLEEKQGSTRGSFKGSIPYLRIISGLENETSLSGSFSLDFDEKDTTLSTTLNLRKDELIELKGSIPIKPSLSNLSVEVEKTRPFSLDILCDARVEDFFDLINIGPHRFQGFFFTDLKVGGTWQNLIVHGDAIVKEGIYENYYTGSYFEEIYAEGLFDGKKLKIKEIEGFDETGGAFTGSAFLSLSERNHFPFSVSLNLDDLIVVDIPIALASAKGKISIEGNQKSTKAVGDLRVVEARFSIPESLPPRIPEIPLARNRQKVEEKTNTKKPYPLSLDVKISSGRNIYIEGRGLNSRWQGNFSLEGTYDDIRTDGELSLAQGNFLFAGRSFDLIEGAFLFNPNEKIPFLKIIANTNILGNSINAEFRGPLNRPNLQFSSSPSLPLSSILSLLIFGEDISELSIFQTASLAATAASLSGQGPDIFQATRQALGVDRLAVVHTPGERQDSGETGSEGSALEVGKYVVNGVLVTLSQGINASSTNVGVQVDLKKGFIFQAETIQQQEQGKFTLRWNYNY